jgi:hypothetical protein
MARTNDSLNFDCPICGAVPQELCELNSGTPRFESHVERWEIAKDHMREQFRKAAASAGEQPEGARHYQRL